MAFNHGVTTPYEIVGRDAMRVEPDVNRPTCRRYVFVEMRPGIDHQSQVLMREKHGEIGGRRGVLRRRRNGIHVRPSQRRTYKHASPEIR